ncbi:MAG: tetratricopeptide repeat protein [SAR324 cluster bacterium]|nr:tetratricopeptide repeat protein [SAR324 cluster bacterium]MBL7035094.1 tetratricopeptide repeat protein [SAR324 cluster bacterium]
MAILTAILVVGYSTFHYISGGSEEVGELHYRTGNLRLEDRDYQAALTEFNLLLKEEFANPAGLLGRALALKELGRLNEALEDITAALELKPDFAAAFANRGIILDNLGQYEKALLDYRKAVQLDPEIGEGPDWITRFLRNQAESPSTIVDRANYLELELKKPAAEQHLNNPEEDAKQRSYKLEGSFSD